MAIKGHLPCNNGFPESGQCTPSCPFPREMCVQSTCVCRPGFNRRQRAQRPGRCMRANRRYGITFIVLAVNNNPVDFSDSYLNPESEEYITGSLAAGSVFPALLFARGINGIISAELTGYFSGSLGMNVTVSADETFTADASGIMTALMQESEANDDNFIADSNSLSVNAASLNVAEMTDINECADGSHDCAQNAVCNNTDPGIGFTCQCNDGYDDLYPDSLPGRYCVLADITSGTTQGTTTDDSPNIGLIAGLSAALGFVVLCLAIVCMCVTFALVQRRKHIAAMMEKSHFVDSHSSYGRNGRNELSYRMETPHSGVYYQYPSSDSKRHPNGNGLKNGNRVSSSKGSASRVTYNGGVGAYRSKNYF